MKKSAKFLALVLVLVMCIGVFTACGSDPTQPSESTPSATTQPTESVAPELQKYYVGIIEQASDSFVKLDVYQESVKAIDALTLVLDDLKSTGDEKYIYLDSDAVYSYIKDGALETLKSVELKQGDIIAVTKTEKDLQSIVILNYTDPDNATTPTTTPTTNPTDSTESTK